MREGAQKAWPMERDLCASPYTLPADRTLTLAREGAVPAHILSLSHFHPLIQLDRLATDQRVTQRPSSSASR